MKSPIEQAIQQRQEGGDHYLNMGVQPWSVIDCWPLEHRIGFYRGCALKYVMRMGAKPGQSRKEEARKAIHYLEKLIGALQSLPADIRSQGMVLMTSRASYELIVKTCRAGIPTLACVSAPTTLAVQLAQQSGLCLAGFARGQACVVYAHAERVGD